MKRLFLVILIILIVQKVAWGGEPSKQSLITFSFSRTQVEFNINDITKSYIQSVDIGISEGLDNVETFCQIDLQGIPKDRILVAFGPNPMDVNFSPVKKDVRLTNGKGRFLFPISIKFIPSWQDKPGRYEGRISILYREGSNNTILGATIPIVINIQPVLVIIVWTEPRYSEDLEISFRVPSPGEWKSREKLWLSIGTNYNSWNLQLTANPLVHEKFQNSVIDSKDLSVRIGNQDKNLANPVIVSSGSSGAQITVGPIEFKLKVTPETRAGDYTGNLEFTFFGTPR
ncbi:MAG: hypothetical protein ACP5RW_04775 [bacterium]